MIIFKGRSTQVEFFDQLDRPAQEIDVAFKELGRARCSHLKILDLGAGTGLLGKTLSYWARRRGWDWQFTNLDMNPIYAGHRNDNNLLQQNQFEMSLDGYGIHFYFKRHPLRL